MSHHYKDLMKFFGDLTMKNIILNFKLILNFIILLIFGRNIYFITGNPNIILNLKIFRKK